MSTPKQKQTLEAPTHTITPASFKKSILSEEESSTQTEVQSPQSIVGLHHHFGNSIVQNSLQNADKGILGSGLETMIQGAFGLEMSGISLGESLTTFMGNSDIHRFIARQKLAGGSDGEVLPDASDSRIQNIRVSGGTPLSPALKQKLEESFDHNFDHVRIHNSGSDASSAEALHAEAFTVANHIYFGAGTYHPETKAGMELLAHELTHVVQHDEGRLASSGEMRVSSPTDAVEVEAVRKGAEIANEIGGFSVASASSTMQSAASLFSEDLPMSIEGQMYNRLEENQSETAQTESTQAAGTVLAREESKTQLDAKVSQSSSVEAEVTFPVYPPFITATAKITFNQTNSESAQSGASTEVEGSIEATINLTLLFVTIKFGIEFKGKVTVQENVDTLTALKQGCQELVAYKMAQDFQPKLQQAKKEIEIAYGMRLSGVNQQLHYLRDQVRQGDWKSVSGESWFYDTPFENLMDEFKYLASDIRSIVNNLGEGQVTESQLVNIERIKASVQVLANATSKEDALAKFDQLITVTSEEWFDSQKRICSQIDQIQCVKNNPKVGFEGSVAFKASGEVGINEDNKVELGVSRVVKIEDEAGKTEFDHSTKTATEVSGKISIAGGRSLEVKCGFEPDFENKTSMSFEANACLGEITTDTPKPSDTHLSGFVSGVRGSLTSSGSLAASAKDAVQQLGSQLGAGLTAQKDAYFSETAMKERAAGSAVCKSIFSVIVKAKFNCGGQGISFSSGSIALKFENSVSIGGAFGASAGVEAKGTVKSGTSVEFSLQRKEKGSSNTEDVHAAAARGIASGGGRLPFSSKIQESFGRHDISGIRSHQGQNAAQAASDIGAKAYATGNDVAFGTSPDLHTAAHEAAHVIQQKSGVSLKGGVGASGDRYERHADAVADLVVQGKSAESLLNEYSGGSSTQTGIQRKEADIQKADPAVKTSKSKSINVSVTFPIYPPFITGTVQVAMNETKSNSNTGKATEVEGIIAGSINLSFLFLSMSFGVELKGKVAIKGDVDTMTAIKKGCQELVAFKMAQDFIPKLKAAKTQIAASYDNRQKEIYTLLSEIKGQVNSGSWKDAANETSYLIFDTPFKNLKDCIGGLASDIRSVTSGLGNGQVHANKLFNMNRASELIRSISNAPDKATASQQMSVFNEYVLNEYQNSKRRVLSEVDQIQCVKNDPSVGFEGSVAFKAGASVALSQSASAGAGGALVRTVGDDLGATKFDHSTKTATEIYAKVGLPNSRSLEVKGNFAPNFSNPTSVEIEGSVSLGVLKIGNNDGSSGVKEFAKSVRSKLPGGSLSASPLQTAKVIGSQIGSGITTAHQSYFSPAKVAERAKACGSIQVNVSVIGKIKFNVKSKKYTFAGGSLTLKLERSIEVGAGFGKGNGVNVKGEIKSGNAFEVSI